MREESGRCVALRDGAFSVSWRLSEAVSAPSCAPRFALLLLLLLLLRHAFRVQLRESTWKRSVLARKSIRARGARVVHRDRSEARHTETR